MIHLAAAILAGGFLGYLVLLALTLVVGLTFFVFAMPVVWMLEKSSDRRFRREFGLPPKK